MADVNLTKAVRSNLSSLQNTATMMAKTQDRLSTGNKVNSALDNPTNFFTAASLNSRAGDLNSLMDSMANGVKTLEAADNGLTSITKNLDSMTSTLRQARQDKTFNTLSMGIDSAATGNLTISGGAVGPVSSSVNVQKAVAAGNGGFSAAGAKTRVGGTLIFTQAGVNNGAAITVNFAKGDTVEAAAQKFNAKMATTQGGSAVNATVENGQLKLSNTNNTTFGTFTGTAAAALGLATQAQANATAATQVGTAVAAGATYTGGNITIGGKTVSLSAGVAADTLITNGARAAAEINDGLAAQGVTDYNATDNGAGVVTISRADGEQFIVGGTGGTALGMAATATTNGVLATALVTAPVSNFVSKTADELVNDINANTSFKDKIRASNDNGKLRIENLSTQKLDIIGASGGNITGATTARSDIAGNSVRAGLADQFNELRDQLDKLSDDASFNGINLLRGDNLKITFNETGTSSISIQSKGAKSVNSSNLKVETTLTAKDLDSDDKIDAYLAQIKTALNSVRSQASAFGSKLSIVQNRQDFTKSMINTLETGAGNLTLADMNGEAANMMALQTRQSLAQSTLSMANQADQGVLQLLR